MKRVVPVLALALPLLVGCAGEPAAPAAARPARPAGDLSGAGVLNVQLRTSPFLPVLEWGHLQIMTPVDAAHPPDPCLPSDPIVPPDGFTNVAVCGRIFNPGGALYAGGALDKLTSDGEVGVAPIQSAHPPDPCRQYVLGGYVRVTNDVAAQLVAATTAFVVRFDGATPPAADGSSIHTSIGGLLDGSAWGPVGDVAETDPFFAANVCQVTITPDS